MRLNKLIERSKEIKQVLEQVLAHPRWYLETEDQKRLNRATLETLYNKIKGI
jgi:hypothetical protein